MATTTQVKADLAAPSGPSWTDWVSFYFNNLYYSGLPMLFWIRPQWNVDQLGSQKGRTILITGGNSGTGFATAVAYYAAGARVIIACRSPERASTAVEQIKRGAVVNMAGEAEYPATPPKGGSIEAIELDLADLRSVEACAERLNKDLTKLDILFANAGIMALPPGEYTKQGYSLQFGTNVLGHQRFISLLLPLLRRTTRADPTNPARLITLSSTAHSAAPSGGVDYSALKRGDTPSAKWIEYGSSKWGDIALARYVDAHYGPKAVKDPVIAMAVHPGLVRTNLWTHLSAAALVPYVPWLVRALNVPPLTGALNQIWAGQLPPDEALAHAGGYVCPYQVWATIRPDLTPENVDKLWEWCDEQAERAK